MQLYVACILHSLLSVALYVIFQKNFLNRSSIYEVSALERSSFTLSQLIEPFTRLMIAIYATIFSLKLHSYFYNLAINTLSDDYSLSWVWVDNSSQQLFLFTFWRFSPKLFSLRLRKRCVDNLTAFCCCCCYRVFSTIRDTQSCHLASNWNFNAARHLGHSSCQRWRPAEIAQSNPLKRRPWCRQNDRRADRRISERGREGRCTISWHIKLKSRRAWH